MNDKIDELNKINKMKRSIIKYWNVSYGQPEKIGMSQEELDEASKMAQKKYQFFLNDAESETSDSDAFFQDEVSQSQIRRILQEKDEHLAEMIEHERHN